MLGNLRLKLLAIFFAVALWSVVAYTSNPTTSHKYNLRIDHPVVPTGLVIVGDLPQVPVTVTATAENFKNFDQRTLHVVANFNNVKVGNNEVPVRVDKGDAPVEVDAPSTVPVVIDQLGTATMTVSIERVHALPSGFHEQTSATTVTPTSVRVDGPKSELAASEAVARVDLDGLQPPGITQPTTVVVRDAKSKKIFNSMKITPLQVTVKLVIQADAMTVPKPVGWTLTGQPAAGYRITNVQIAPLEVQASGLQSALATLNLLATDPVDVSNAKSDVVRTVTIRPPAGIEVNQKTATVHVFISPAPGVSPSP